MPTQDNGKQKYLIIPAPIVKTAHPYSLAV